MNDGSNALILTPLAVNPHWHSVREIMGVVRRVIVLVRVWTAKLRFAWDCRKKRGTARRSNPTRSHEQSDGLQDR
jgi:hypothetical protein